MYVTARTLTYLFRRGSRNFSKGGGGLRRKILKEKCLLIHVSTRVHIKTRQTCNSFSLLPFQEDCIVFFALFNYSLLFLKFERGGATPITPPLDPPMLLQCSLTIKHFILTLFLFAYHVYCHNKLCTLMLTNMY